jgi:hypothetical protein
MLTGHGVMFALARHSTLSVLKYSARSNVRANAVQAHALLCLVAALASRTYAIHLFRNPFRFRLNPYFYTQAIH